jgi:hypothetical protein
VRCRIALVTTLKSGVIKKAIGRRYIAKKKPLSVLMARKTHHERNPYLYPL